MSGAAVPGATGAWLARAAAQMPTWERTRATATAHASAQATTPALAPASALALAQAPTLASAPASALARALPLALALALAPGLARAQLADPTRPPPEAQLAAGAQAAPVHSGPQLQSVLNGNHGRQVAVIDGQALRVGDKINGATLVQVGKDQVVLQRGRVRQVLKLYPDASAASGTVRRQRASNTAPEN
ncbi:UNVERIFIED_ORG: hypothetical protein JN05_01112 [Zoogloea ramigera]|uniref:MSHA biogenesis protein MshK n=1 Tax=Duganella zoogloeoides TaxID=75659 RepID=A0ABZ0Y3U9_9BURK|nr:hypothetical protein [Duganella zoogloeoides]WQH06717.1 hypothetical protein SR858_10445 [Duganella zoogloeoides]